MNSWYAADATAFSILHSEFWIRFQNSSTHTFRHRPQVHGPQYLDAPVPLHHHQHHHPPTHHLCKVQAAACNQRTCSCFSFLLREPVDVSTFGVASVGWLVISCYCCKLFMHFEVYLKHEQQHRNSLHGISNVVQDSHSCLYCSLFAVGCWLLAAALAVCWFYELFFLLHLLSVGCPPATYGHLNFRRRVRGSEWGVLHQIIYAFFPRLLVYFFKRISTAKAISACCFSFAFFGAGNSTKGCRMMYHSRMPPPAPATRRVVQMLCIFKILFRLEVRSVRDSPYVVYTDAIMPTCQKVEFNWIESGPIGGANWFGQLALGLVSGLSNARNNSVSFIVWPCTIKCYLPPLCRKRALRFVILLLPYSTLEFPRIYHNIFQYFRPVWN